MLLSYVWQIVGNQNNDLNLLNAGGEYISVVFLQNMMEKKDDYYLEESDA